MTVSDVRKGINEVDKIVVRMDFIEDRGPVDIRVTKTEFKKHLKGFSRNEEVSVFFENDTMIVDAMPKIQTTV